MQAGATAHNGSEGRGAIASDPRPRTVRRVLRDFGGPQGRVYKSGEVVDTTDWRHATRLVEQHKLSDYLIN